MLAATTILFQTHVRRTFLSKRALLCLGLALFPVAVSVFIARAAPEDPDVPVLFVSYVLVVQSILPLVAVALGSAVVAEEIEDRTITYLLTRPIPRASILVGRWLACLLLVALLASLSAWLVVTFLAPLAANDPEHVLPAGFRSRFVIVALMGGLAYSALFAALGAFFKRAVLIGLGYTFVIEGFFANLPGSNQALTVQYYLKSFLIADDPDLIERYAGWFITNELAEPAQAVRTLLIIGVVALAFGSWILSRRQYVLPS